MDDMTGYTANAECAACAMSRRNFLSTTVVAVAVAALAACGGDALTAPASVDGTIRVSDHASLASVNGVALVELSGSPVAIVRTGATTFVALSRICPHQGYFINVNGSEFLCTGHGAQFTNTGTWKGGQPTSNMRSYAVVFNETAGTIKIG